MCGIVGILGKEPVALNIVEALRRLEYRGYDSAGVATLEQGRIERRRAPGKLKNLSEKLAQQPMMGVTGIGHTRWATHGAANEDNAHPHTAGDVVIVHNGIIENFRELKEELAEHKVVFQTQTDTEVVAHLLAVERQKGTKPVEAVAAVLPRLRGAFAFAILFKDEPDLLIGARQGSPLAIGHGDGENFLGSDAVALSPFTNRVTYLEEGDWVVLTRNTVQVFDVNNKPVDRPMSFSQASAMLVDKGNHRHYMAKEIAEQPEVVVTHCRSTLILHPALCVCLRRCHLISRHWTASALLRAAQHPTQGSHRNTGLSASHVCHVKSISHQNSVTAKPRCRRTV
jgi:glutamine---fructose-6-phosphate transaminase (isomerizing)